MSISIQKGKTQAEIITEELTKDGWILDYKTIDSGGYKRDSQFTIVLHKNNQHFSTTYTKGWGHRKWIKKSTFSPCCGYWDRYFHNGKVIAIDIPTSLINPSDIKDVRTQRHQQHIFDDFELLSEPIHPTLDEVVFSIYMNAQCVINGESFEEWCNDLGYSTDSIKGKQAYDYCRDAWSFLVRCNVDLDKLENLFKDY